MAILIVVLVAIAVIAGVLVATGVVDVAPPAVTSMDTSWGTVTDETTAIETRVTIDNPNPVGVPGLLGVDYRASMNGVTLAEGEESGVGFGTGESTLAFEATMQNDRIPDWWVTHVNGDERSELRIRGTVSGPLGVSETMNDSRTIRTDMLSGFVSSDRRTISAAGRELLVLSNQSARWGEATADRTPIVFSATVSNRHEYPISLAGIRYQVTMNGIEMGEGVTAEGLRVAPNETTRAEFTVMLDTARMADWWASHLRNDSRTELAVSMEGVIERDGERKRVPVSLFDAGVRFETDLLGSGETTVESLEASGDPGPSYERPAVSNVEYRWGNVTDAVTEVRTSATIENPNSGTVADLLRLSLGQTVTINGIEVADDRTNVGALESGANEIVHTVSMDNDAVPEWWAKHVNDGEESTVVVDPSARADVGFTTFDVAVDDRRSTVETDLLSGLSTGQRPLSFDGRRIGTIRVADAEWGRATTERTPVEVTVRIENAAPVPVTVSNPAYDVRMNGIVIGNGTTSDTRRIPAGETRTLTYTMDLNTGAMDEWWVSHVRNGERSVVAYAGTVEVTVRDRSKRVRIVSTETTVETDFLNATAGTTATPDVGSVPTSGEDADADPRAQDDAVHQVEQEEPADLFRVGVEREHHVHPEDGRPDEQDESPGDPPEETAHERREREQVAQRADG